MRANLMKIIGLLGLAVFIVLASSCAGTVTKKMTQTVTTQDAVGSPVTVVTVTESKMPKDIAFKESIVAERAACIPPANNGDSGTVNLSLINPMELKSGAAQDRYIQEVSRGQLMDITQTALGIIKGDPVVACYESITATAVAYFKMEAQRSSNRWGFGKFFAGVAGTYLAFDSVAGALVSAGAMGDTSIGEVNISGASSGGAGGEGAGGLGGTIDQNINIGNGSLNNAKDGGIMNFGEKPINGNNNVFEDADSPNTSLF